MLGLASVLVGALLQPPHVPLLGPRGRVLVVPGPVVLEVPHLAGSAPRLGDPPPLHPVAVGGRLVERVAPLGGSRGLGAVSHVDGEAVDPAVLEAVASEEVVGGGVGTVLELALDAYVNAVGDDVLGPGVVLAIGMRAVLNVSLGGDMIYARTVVIVLAKERIARKEDTEAGIRLTRFVGFAWDDITVVKRSIVFSNCNNDIVRRLRQLKWKGSVQKKFYQVTCANSV